VKASWRALPLCASVACVAASAPRDATKGDAGGSTSSSVAVYALSRGKGVPDATRRALDEARALFEEERRSGRVDHLEEAPIGLEGEKRLCAGFTTRAAADQAVARLREIASRVELLNVVEEPCSSEK
jgi:hypothetical protein